MKITVYASASDQVPQRYLDAAAQLGQLMACAGHTLINGAGRTGLMNATANALLAVGGRAVGLIPQFMVDEGWHHSGMSELIITPDMHSRKQQMAQLGEACIACPGGIGTLEELLEIITWKQLGLYVKPIVVLNTDGYFDPLLAQLRRCADERFMRSEHHALWQVATTPAEALRCCENTPHTDPAERSKAILEKTTPHATD